MRSKIAKTLACLITGLALTSCDTMKNYYDLYFVVPRNPFNPPAASDVSK